MVDEIQSSEEMDGEIQGLEVFLSRPENYMFAEELFNNIEKMVYHAVDFGTAISDSEKYELGRYIGKSQILFEIAKDIIKSSSNEKEVIKVGKAFFNVINNVSLIYVVLVRNVDINRFEELFKIFKENVEKLNEIVYKNITV